MPILMLILTAVGGAIWWWIRSNPREAIHTAQDIATTVRNAPRRLAFRKQTRAHPVEGIDDERIAICAIGQAFLELDGLPTSEQREKLHFLVRTKLESTEEEAEEMEVLGRWLQAQCNGAIEAIPRLGRRLHKIDSGAAWDKMQSFVEALVGDELSPAQIDAIGDLKLAFRRK